jgi:hypothetical protein
MAYAHRCRASRRNDTTAIIHLTQQHKPLSRRCPFPPGQVTFMCARLVVAGKLVDTNTDGHSCNGMSWMC